MLIERHHLHDFEGLVDDGTSDYIEVRAAPAGIVTDIVASN
jgi:hypothetical protein